MVTNCFGTASSASSLDIHIIHPYSGDIEIHLYAPDGTSYFIKDDYIHNHWDDIHESIYPINLSTESRNGTWYLWVHDIRTGNAGRVDSWTLRL